VLLQVPTQASGLYEAAPLLVRSHTSGPTLTAQRPERAVAALTTPDRTRASANGRGR
jgi:hypothetical protein